MSAATVASASSTTASRASAGPSTTPATVSAAIGTVAARADDVLRCCFPVEIRLVTFSEISSAFNGQSRNARRHSFLLDFRAALGRNDSATHLCALLFQNSFA